MTKAATPVSTSGPTSGSTSGSTPGDDQLGQARLAVGKGATALGQWLRRPLTSLHLILGIFGILTLFGLVMVLSASSVEALSSGGSSYSVFTRQLIFCVPGLVLFWLGLRIPPKTLRACAPALLVVGIVLLMAVLVVGVDRNGSKAWFALGQFSIQPSEGVKVALTLWGAHVLAARRQVMHRWKYALSPVVPVTIVLLLLLVLEPDLGMTITLGAVMMALLFFGGAPMRLLALLAGGATAGTLVLAFSMPTRLARITAFLSSDPSEAAQTTQYQLNQSLYSLADGGLFGVGLGQGRAKYYLPNAHNDFIFAVIGGELGFVGAFLVLALFGLLAYTGFRIAARTTDPWLKLVVATMTTTLVIQAVINIAYVVGMLPVTGLQLPLISSGGTSLVVTMFMFGVLANAARHEPEAIAALRPRGAARGPAKGIGRWLRIPAPQPYKAPTVRQSVRQSVHRGVAPAQRSGSRAR
jgi:cell division protein FtsW